MSFAADGPELLQGASTAGAPLDTFVVLGTSHRLAPLNVRERLALPEARARLGSLARAYAGMERPCEIVTCNRVECWGLAKQPDSDSAARRLAEALSLEPGALQVMSGEPAYLHAVRVASGLDSAVWGEPQIAGQVRACSRNVLDVAGSAATPSPLGRIVRAAQGVRRRAGLAADSRGAPEAAAELVGRRLAGGEPSVLVLGSGSVGRRAAACASRFAQVTVADRSLEKARRAAAEAHGRAMPLTEGICALGEFDASIVALSAPSPLVSNAHLRGAGRRTGARLLLVDLSFPRAVAPSAGEVPGVHLLNVDDLAEEEARWRDPAPVEAAERAAGEAARALYREHQSRLAHAVLAEFRSRAEAIRLEETSRARRRLSGDPDVDAAVLDKLAERLVNRLLHGPTQELRAAWGGKDAEAVRRAARRLFDLEAPP